MALGLASLGGVTAQGADAGVEFFEKNIRPVLVERCYECHSAKAKKTKGGLAMDTKAGLLKGGDAGPALIAGDPDGSRIIEAVRYKNQDMQMPPKSPIPAAEVALLEQWVKAGAPDPRTEEVANAAGAKPVNVQEGRKHWAFKPLAEVTVPEVKGDAARQVQTPIDAFLLAKMTESGLPAKFAPAAEPRTLARRLAYDLTGLPPEPSKGQDNPKALVETLLASPHYGEQWGRHWLDVVRYADSNGMDENVALGHAWRYRDYVVKSFNDDKPFDRFVVEQLAGDLLNPADPEERVEAITGTGFLALGAKVLAEPDMQKLEMDIIDEQLDTMGKAFLGMTFGCVRCHDHKFDPIRTEDYYAMAAIFRSTRSLSEKRTGAIKYWYEHDLSTKDQQAAHAALEAKAKETAAAVKKFSDAERKKLRDELNANAVRYLAAAKELTNGMEFAEVQAVASKQQLRPRYLLTARQYLDRNPQVPFFAAWRAAKSAIEVTTHYGPLFADSNNPDAKAALTDVAGFLTIPDKNADAFDDATLAKLESMMSEAMAMEGQIKDTPAVMGVTEGSVAKTLPVHIRGSYLTLGKAVERGFPEVMKVSFTKPILPTRESGRLQLARWIASSEHPLTARVIVNRVWAWHFGKGLVTSTDNFGLLGATPSHPELLDYLARWFIENGWSVKALHRMILASAVYQQGSGQAVMADPENKLLSHFPLRRLSAEELRDSLLMVGRQLDLNVGGKTIPQRNREFVFNHTSKDHTTYETKRRALYLPIIRNNLYDILEQFDYPDPTTPTGTRNSTTVAPQALILLNAPVVMEAAKLAAKDLHQFAATDDTRLTQLYQRLYNRLPTAAEAERCLRFISGNPENWPLLVQTLMASNEFIYLQ